MIFWARAARSARCWASDMGRFLYSNAPKGNGKTRPWNLAHRVFRKGSVSKHPDRGNSPSHTQRGGGDGSRTRVLKAIHTTFYMFRRSLISERAGEPSRFPPQSIHVIDSPGAAVAPARASLLSSHSSLAGVGWSASWLIKPRERDLRNLHLFCLIRFFTRPTNHPRHAGRASHSKSKPLRPRVAVGKLRRALRNASHVASCALSCPEF